LFAGIRPLTATQSISYQDLFQTATGLNPLIFSLPDYTVYAQRCGLADADRVCGGNHADWLDLIFSIRIQPNMTQGVLYMVYGYPACMSSLARINAENPLITDRVELFFDGVELGNGYYELTDAQEQEQRFDREIAERAINNQARVNKDQRLLAALNTGLPDCSGIAIGLDRLLMILSDSPAIANVLSFSIRRA